MLLAVNVCLISPALDAVVSPISTALCAHQSIPADVQYHVAPAYDDGASTPHHHLVRGVGRPHITLAQLFIKDSALEAFTAHLRTALEELVGRFSEKTDGDPSVASILAHMSERECMHLTHIENGPVFASIPAEDAKPDATPKELRLPAVAVETQAALSDVVPSFLVRMHQVVCGVACAHEAARQEGGGGNDSSELDKRGAYHPLFPGNAASVAWVDTYISKSSSYESGDSTSTSKPNNYHPHATLGTSAIYLTEDQAKNLFPDAPVTIPLSQCSIAISRMGNFCSCFEVLDVL